MSHFRRGPDGPRALVAFRGDLPDMTASDQNVLREDLPLPLCLLRAGALDRNVARFHRCTESAGVLLGPSHPCTTFDKWRRVVHLVDDDYNLLEGIPTYF